MHSKQSEADRPPRKAPSSQVVQTASARLRPVSPLLRTLIEDRVAVLHADRCAEEYSSVIAREFRIGEALVDRVMAGLILEHRAEAATLRSGVSGALDEAQRAGRTVWEVA